tara:strand:+ start:2454 stop:2729 length:276 start_codon:yes stop_codon:yes gene_type:complete
MVDHPEPMLFFACILLGVWCWVSTWIYDEFLIGYFIFAIILSIYPIYGIGILLSRAFNAVQEIRKDRAAKKTVSDESDSDEEESGFQPIKF